jgi:hypothetical protein
MMMMIIIMTSQLSIQWVPPDISPWKKAIETKR